MIELPRLEAVFYRTGSGNEPVREWLKALSKVDRRAIGGTMILLHGFIKKTRTTPDSDRALARKRQRELER